MRGRSASNAAHNSCFRPAAFLRDRLQRQEHGAIGEIGPRHDVLDAVQDHRPGGVEQHLVLIGIELAHREAAAGGKPAKRVGNPGGQARHIVEGEHMAVAGGDEQVAILARQGPQGRGVRIEQRPQDRREGGLRRTLLARQHDHRIGTAIAQARERPGDHQHEIGVGLHVEERAQRLDRSAAHRDRHRLHAGQRGGSAPADCRSRASRWRRSPPRAMSHRRGRDRAGRRARRRGYGPAVPAHRNAPWPRSRSAPIAAPPNSARRRVSSKKRRASQRRKPLARIGQVSRWPLMSRSAKPVPSGVWNSSAVCARSIRISACVGPRPPVSPFSSAMASSSAVTRHPAFFSCDRSASKAARLSCLQRGERFQRFGHEGRAGIGGGLLGQPASGSGISSAASMASAIRFSGSTDGVGVHRAPSVETRARGP